jgi:23S rRNA pseudouridine2457 synthase
VTLLAFNKPMGVLCKFTDEGGRPTLADFIDVPRVYPVGRLDHDSEGLLLLTDDGALQHRLAHPSAHKQKLYWVQVDRVPTDEALEALRKGVVLKDGPTRPAVVRRLEDPPLWPRDPPVRFRLNVPTAWIEVGITEGRNRQVRRMTAHVGFPTLRLVRMQIGPYALGDLAPGAYRRINVA